MGRLLEAPTAKEKWREIRHLNVSASSLPSPLLRFDAATLNAHYSATVNCHQPLSELDYDSVAKSPRSTYLNCSFDFRPVSAGEVLAALNAASSKASGHDGLTVPMLRLASASCLQHFTTLANFSLAQACFPSEWKSALNRPLAKKKTISQPADTRPIAQPPELSKVLERLVHDQLKGYLEVNGIFHQCQAGYRQGHSTQTALLDVFESVRHAIDHRMLIFLIFFDFSKAFDTIPHATLLTKLRRINVSNRVLRWFFSYLADRLQAVVDEGGNVSE